MAGRGGVPLMFSWCAYCQKFIGEKAPYDQHLLTHGICDACFNLVEDPSFVPDLKAQEIFSSLFGRSGRLQSVEYQSFLEEGRKAGIPQSDLLVGILQPALYEVGALWESGRLSVTEEHAFSAWCAEVLSHVSIPSQGPPRAILFPAPDNFHLLGLQFLSAWLKERGVPNLVLGPEVSTEERLERCWETRPRMVGVSVALPETISATFKWAQGLQERLPPGTRMCLGGRALRGIENPPEGLTVCTDLEQFRHQTLAP